MLRSRVSSESQGFMILLMVFLISLVFRLWLLEVRWVNPDEGAHLMDAVFVLDGKVPILDFDSRQPFYTYVTAIAFNLFGQTLDVGRALMLACSMLTGVFVFLIARALFETKVAVLAAATFWLLPLEVFLSPIVKTQPMVMLLTSASFYAVVRYGRAQQLGWLTTSGALAALGFYVRESALIVPAVVAILLPVQAGWRWALRGYVVFAAGYVCVAALVMLYFATEMGLATALGTGGLNPLGFVLQALGWGAALLDSVPEARLLAARSWDYYYAQVRDSTFMHVFLLASAGVGIALAGFSMPAVRSGEERRSSGIAYALLCLWIAFLLGAYGYFFAVRGFFIDYSREFLPPLSILFAAGLFRVLPVLERQWMLEVLVVGVLAGGVAIFLVQPHYGHLFSMGQYAAIGIAVTAILYVAVRPMTRLRHMAILATLAMLFIVIVMSRRPPLHDLLSGRIPSVVMIVVLVTVVAVGLAGTTRDWMSHYLRFVGLSLVVGSLLVGVSYSSLRLSASYNSVWSREAVRGAVEYLRENTVEGDEVMSGAVIWELEASLRPFQRISHPLSFRSSISRKQLDSIETGLLANPPKVIVLDGYTEQTYFRWVQSLPHLLGRRYELKATVGPARYPVRIYQRRELVGGADHAGSGLIGVLETMAIQNESNRTPKR